MHPGVQHVLQIFFTSREASGLDEELGRGFAASFIKTAYLDIEVAAHGIGQDPAMRRDINGLTIVVHAHPSFNVVFASNAGRNSRQP
jgi:hypothetical protein